MWRINMAEMENDSVTEIKSCELIISRVFDAPRELVFKAYAESERLERWWGAKDFKTRVEKLDFGPGGDVLYRVSAPDSRQIWGKFGYREIVAPERIVFINSFADEDGNTIRAPFSPIWPLEVLSVMTFAEHEGKTAVTVRSVPFYD